MIIIFLFLNTMQVNSQILSWTLLKHDLRTLSAYFSALNRSSFCVLLKRNQKPDSCLERAGRYNWNNMRVFLDLFIIYDLLKCQKPFYISAIGICCPICWFWIVCQKGALEAAIRNLKLAGHVGFDTLPDQLVNKSVQNGFIFNILCIGKLSP